MKKNVLCKIGKIKKVIMQESNQQQTKRLVVNQGILIGQNIQKDNRNKKFIDKQKVQRNPIS